MTDTEPIRLPPAVWQQLLTQLDTALQPLHQALAGSHAALAAAPDLAALEQQRGAQLHLLLRRLWPALQQQLETLPQQLPAEEPAAGVMRQALRDQLEPLRQQLDDSRLALRLCFQLAAPAADEDQAAETALEQRRDLLLSALDSTKERLLKTRAALAALGQQPAATATAEETATTGDQGELARAAALWQQLQPRLYQWLIAWPQAQLSRWQQQRRHPAPPPEKLLQRTDLPALDEILRQGDSLPPLYHHLFDLQALPDRELLIGRQAELAQLDQAWQRWQEGRAASVALIGPQGGGSSSLLNSFISALGPEPAVLHLRPTRRLQQETDLLHWLATACGLKNCPADGTGLIEALLRQPRSVVVVEDSHLLALRVIDGYRAARLFFTVLQATSRHLLWLVAFRRPCWQRLDAACGVGQLFSQQLTIGFEGVAPLRELLLLRQRISGYSLHFLAETETADEDNQQKPRADRFFRELYAAAGSNLTAALYYWRLSARFHAELQRIELLPLGRLDSSPLRNLALPLRLCLAEVLGHGDLTSDEHQRIFLCPPEQSHRQLQHLCSLGLLHRQDSPAGPCHRVSPLYQHLVSSTLEAMNLLY